MASRRSPRSRSSRRQPAAQNNSTQVVIIGAGAVVVVALGIWALNRGGGEKPATMTRPAAKQP